jgi:hypothetical protein
MAKRGKRLLGIVPSDSADVKSYKLYWGPSKNADGSDHVLNNDETTGPVDPSVDVGMPTVTQDVPDVGTVLVVDLAAIPEIQALPDGEYDFGSAAFDGVNESDITEAEDVTIDVTPPDAPAKVVILNPAP